MASSAKISEKEENFAYAIQLALSSVLPMAMQTAIEVGIFDIIAKAGPGTKLSASEIVAEMSTQNKDAPVMVDRILRLLAGHSILECSVDGLRRLYSLTPVSKCFVRNEDGVSLGPLMALIQDKVFLDSCFKIQSITSPEKKMEEEKVVSFAEVEPELNKEEGGGETYAYAMQLATSIVLPMALREATELGVFEVIAKAGKGAKLSASEIVAQLNSRNSDAAVMLDRVLRLLATHSVLGCSVLGGERLYSLTPVSKYFVRNQDGVQLGALIALNTDKIFLDSWSQLKEAILEGGVPFDRVHGTHAFEYPGLDPRFNEVFNRAMYNHTTLVIKNILEVYKGFEHVKQLVDVGGGLGVTLKAVTSKYPRIKGINFDLPHVIQHAPNYPGVEHVGGDMFESVPNGDAIFMKWILHDWSDEHCLRLLKNCYKSIPEDGKVIVVEAILTELPETSAASKGNSQTDVLMLTQNPGGKERTKLEFMNLATAAGFRGIRYECFVCNFWVMEFYK